VQQKSATCFATLLQNELSSYVAQHRYSTRFTAKSQNKRYAFFCPFNGALTLATSKPSLVFHSHVNLAFSKGRAWSQAEISGKINFGSYCNSHVSFSRRLKFVAWILRKKNLARSVEHPRLQKLKRWVMATSSIIFLYATAGLHVMRTTARSWGSWYQLMRAESQGEAH